MKYGEVTPLIGSARDLRDFCRWLDQCPFLDGTPFFESAEQELQPMRDRFRALYEEELKISPEEGDPDLFGPDVEYSETEIWEAMLERIETSEENKANGIE